MFSLKVKHFFDAAHKLTDTPDLVTKACARLHGHTYAVVVDLQSKDEALNSAGMVIDFKAVKNVIDMLDHQYVNDVFEDQNFKHQPTAENIARFIAEQIESQLGRFDYVAVEICEGYKGYERSSWASYRK